MDDEIRSLMGKVPFRTKNCKKSKTNDELMLDIPRNASNGRYYKKNPNCCDEIKTLVEATKHALTVKEKYNG